MFIVAVVEIDKYCLLDLLYCNLKVINIYIYTFN